MIAGPSEIGVIASSQSVPSQVAADLLSQAEHDKLARPMLITDDRQLADAVNKELARQVALLPRQEIAQAAMDNEGFIAVVDDIDDAFTLMNAVAPEHLEVQLPDAIEYLNQIKNAGSVFLASQLQNHLVTILPVLTTFCQRVVRHDSSHHWVSKTS